MSATTEEASVPPQVLLPHHLKSLKLPTFAREYENVAAECVRAQIDYPRYLLRLCELERIDRGYVPVTAVGSELLFEEIG